MFYGGLCFGFAQLVPPSVFPVVDRTLVPDRDRAQVFCYSSPSQFPDLLPKDPLARCWAAETLGLVGMVGQSVIARPLVNGRTTLPHSSHPPVIEPAEAGHGHAEEDRTDQSSKAEKLGHTTENVAAAEEDALGEQSRSGYSAAAQQSRCATSFGMLSRG